MSNPDPAERPAKKMSGSGYITAFHIRGVPVRMRWTFPLGGLVVATWGRANWREAITFCLAYTLLVMAHEFGHATAAMSQRVKVLSIDIDSFGGCCRLGSVPRSAAGAMLIYAAGMLVQLVLFAVAASYVAFYGWPRSVVGGPLLLTLTVVNLFVFLICVLPHRSLSGVSSDGFVLWRLILHRWKGHVSPLPVPTDQSPVFDSATSLLSQPDLVPKGFVTGIELLNDATTPMDFVIWILTKNLRLQQGEAMDVMLKIHARGGVLLPLASREEADRVAAAFAEDCRIHHQTLVCRAVSVAG